MWNLVFTSPLPTLCFLFWTSRGPEYAVTTAVGSYIPLPVVSEKCFFFGSSAIFPNQFQSGTVMLANIDGIWKVLISISQSRLFYIFGFLPQQSRALTNTQPLNMQFLFWLCIIFYHIISVSMKPLSSFRDHIPILLTANLPLFQPLEFSFHSSYHPLSLILLR